MEQGPRSFPGTDGTLSTNCHGWASIQEIGPYCIDPQYNGKLYIPNYIFELTVRYHAAPDKKF